MECNLILVYHAFSVDTKPEISWPPSSTDKKRLELFLCLLLKFNTITVNDYCRVPTGIKHVTSRCHNIIYCNIYIEYDTIHVPLHHTYTVCGQYSVLTTYGT